MQSCSCKNLGVRQVAKKKKNSTMPQVRWWEKRVVGTHRPIPGSALDWYFWLLKEPFCWSCNGRNVYHHHNFLLSRNNNKKISITYTRDIIELSFLSLQIMYVHSLVVIITVEKYTTMRIKYLPYFKKILAKSFVGP